MVELARRDDVPMEVIEELDDLFRASLSGESVVKPRDEEDGDG